ncbi:MAG: AAA family ATPase [Bacteroidales bacterium]|nr:AAA family ATPase [Bacteroidales bacterium]
MEVIQRNTLNKLRAWRLSETRKPLVLRGARQVGKTTLVKEFAKEYDIFLHLNLEKEDDCALFEANNDVNLLIQAIFMHKRQQQRNGSTLLFIDEIQNSRRAVAMLRYFYEEANHIHVIAAGSLLETVMDLRKISFPVGRVEFMALRPCSFTEFQNGTGDDFDAENVCNLNVIPAIHERVMRQFREYTLVGGMPAAIVQYAKKRDVLSVSSIYTSLLQTYKDDVEKYSSSTALIKVIRTILEVGWTQAAEAIVFEGFANTNYRSREISEAFQTLSKAMLMELVYPTGEVQSPVLPNQRRKPKLLWLDTGLVNFAVGLQQDVFSTPDINDVWRGRIAEHIVGQELIALNDNILAKRSYWRNDKHGSDAEVDFLYPFQGLQIPIEVKSGHNARLRSLHQFMDATNHGLAIRFWSKPYSVDDVTTPNGKHFRLVNVPFYYAGQVELILGKEM